MRLAVFLAAALPGHAWAQPRFQVTDSGLWATFPPKNVYWIDDRRILFETGEDFTYRSGGKPVIAIWPIGGKVSIHKANARVHCYHAGTLWYYVGSSAEGWRGPLGSEHPYEKPAGAVEDRLNCSYRETGRVRPLLPGHGRLEVPLDDARMDSPLARLSAPLDFVSAKNDRKRLPLTNLDIARLRFFDFKGAYFIQDANGRHFWWLTPDGALSQISVPPGQVWNRGGSVIGAPTAAGLLIFYHGGARSETDPGDQGIYLYAGGVATRILSGYADGPAVASDGCRVAFAHAPSMKASRFNPSNARTLKVLDLCAR